MCYIWQIYIHYHIQLENKIKTLNTDASQNEAQNILRKRKLLMKGFACFLSQSHLIR